jgi:hypothetical protein
MWQESQTTSCPDASMMRRFWVTIISRDRNRRRGRIPHSIFGGIVLHVVDLARRLVGWFWLAVSLAALSLVCAMWLNARAMTIACRRLDSSPRARS